MEGPAGPRRRAWIALLLGLAGAAYDPSATANAVKTTLALGGAVAALALTLPSWLRGDRPLLSRAGLLAVVLSGWLAVSLGRSSYQADVIVLGPWFAAAGVCLVLAGLEPSELRRLGGRVATVLAALSAAACLAQAAAGARGSALHGLQGNPNWLGLVLGCALPLVIDHQRALRRPSDRGERWATWAALGLTVPALALSESRTAWLGVGVAALLFARGRWRLMALGLVAAALGVAAIAGDLLGALEGRSWIWRVSARAALEAPLLGHGTGSFPFVYLEQQGALLQSLPLDQAATRFVHAVRAHDDWLELWCEGGLLAPLLLFACLAVGSWDNRRRWPGAAAAILVAAVGALGDAPFTLPAVFVLLAAPLASGPVLVARRRDAVLAFAILMASALLLARGTTDWLTERRLSRARELLPVERLALLSRAAAAAPHHGEAALALGLALLEGGEPDRALAQLTHAKTRFANPSTAIAVGNAHLAAGRAAEAIAHYRGALRLHPASLRAHLNLAEALRRTGRLDEAAVHLEAARELWPHAPRVEQLTEELRRDLADAEDGRAPAVLDDAR